jgi:flagellar biosynthesis protein FliQ
LVAMVIALALSLPWVLSQLLNYSERLISNIPNTL